MSRLFARAAAVVLLAALTSLPGRLAAQARIAPGASVIVRWNDGSAVDWPGTADRVGLDGRIFVKFSGAVAPDDQWVDAKLVRAAAGAPATPDASWDEWVPPARLRKTAQPSAAAQKAAASPVGRYQCATFDAGQLNIVTEFTLAANGTYVDSFRKGSGRYSYDAKTGRIQFLSGPQKSNAPVRFEAKGPRGRPYIAITYPGGAKLDCYR